MLLYYNHSKDCPHITNIVKSINFIFDGTGIDFIKSSDLAPDGTPLVVYLLKNNDVFEYIFSLGSIYYPDINYLLDYLEKDKIEYVIDKYIITQNFILKYSRKPNFNHEIMIILIESYNRTHSKNLSDLGNFVHHIISEDNVYGFDFVVKHYKLSDNDKIVYLNQTINIKSVGILKYIIKNRIVIMTPTILRKIYGKINCNHNEKYIKIILKLWKQGYITCMENVKFQWFRLICMNYSLSMVQLFLEIMTFSHDELKSIINTIKYRPDKNVDHDKIISLLTERFTSQ
jgi:hypothetical protein